MFMRSLWLTEFSNGPRERCPQSYSCYYVTLHDKKDFPDVIKVTNHLTTDREVIQMDQPHHRTPLKTTSFLWLVAERESGRLEA